MTVVRQGRRGQPFVCTVGLVDAADGVSLKSGATLAAGDVLVSRDGSAPSNIETLPTEIGTTGVYLVQLSAAEMTAGVVAVVFHDAVGAEWLDVHLEVRTDMADEVHLAKAALVNRREHTVATGMDVIRDDDGATALVTLTPDEVDGVIIVQPS